MPDSTYYALTTRFSSVGLGNFYAFLQASELTGNLKSDLAVIYASNIHDAIEEFYYKFILRYNR